MKKYIHYGNTHFDPDRFTLITDDWMPKPRGGLWGSPVDAAWGWKQWCESEDFRECVEENSFVFTLREGANVLYIDSLEQLKTLPKRHPDYDFGDWVIPDFSMLAESGVDAVEVSISSDRRLYWALYGWDCDSIVVMNPDVILTVDER